MPVFNFMSSKIFSAAVIGLGAEIVEVEADTGGGEYGSFSIVGLPDTAVSESRERVRSAIKNSMFDFPKVKVTVNLAPADLKKHGPSYDLPIALSILVVTNKVVNMQMLNQSLFVGELALSGEVRPINGILPIALMAREKGIKKIFVPRANALEAKLVKELDIMPLDNLKQFIDFLEGREKIEPIPDQDFNFLNEDILFDMSHIRGQEHVKRAMEISAAGAHNMIMSGPPGSGKTLIARTMPSILPDLTLDEALEVTKICSVAGLLLNKSLVTSRPFRSPHHTASGVALVGGGTWPKPGEISLAHRGVLFLDEFAEFSRQALENLRQPLEDGIIHISRAAGNLSFPAKFILMAAMNPCPCGFSGDSEKNCACSQSQIMNYKKKISGPILDRIDIFVEVPRIKFEKLSSDIPGNSSKEIKIRVQKAREIQTKRFENTKFVTNSEMTSEAVRNFCPIDEPSKKLLQSAVDRMHLSARAYFRILKLARTIADLDNCEKIDIAHIAEALQYRPKND